MSDNRLWWKKPLRVIQTNLQVRDTPKMDPAKIAREIEEMGGNTLCTNVGGIYAWYPTQVLFHHQNEYLPTGFDLLEALLEECHKRDIRVLARYDFSKTVDYVYQQRPQWFVREYDMSPHAYGTMRPGDWSLLYTTCVNGGYRNAEVGVPAIQETLEKYDIDGIFFNAPHYELCYCDSCRAKYRERYGKELPPPPPSLENADSPTFAHRRMPPEIEKDWASSCVKDNIANIYGAIKEKRPEVPMVLYYGLYNDNLNDRIATADMICTEAQDVLSLGAKDLPKTWLPTLNGKMGRTLEDAPAPFGIIHSCPGMDWRHTGLPPAEFRFWLAQVPAGGAQIWHSITGFPDTIPDKRLLDAVSEVNHNIMKIEEDMDGAASLSQVLLIWNSKSSGDGWTEALMGNQIQFDVLSPYQVTAAKLKRYDLVILPEETHPDADLTALLDAYVRDGGNLIAEEVEISDELASLAGVAKNPARSEYLAASYWRFEEDCGRLQETFEHTPLLAHRGTVAYCRPLADTRVLATLVPPFAPLDAVGAPPERASMSVAHSDLPLCTLREHGKGNVLLLPFQFGKLVLTYKLGEHYRLARNCVDFLLEGARHFVMNAPVGIQASLYQNGEKLVLHLVNAIGQRPLASSVPCHGLTFSLTLPAGKGVASVTSRLAGQAVSHSVKDHTLQATLPILEVWDTVVIELQ